MVGHVDAKVHVAKEEAKLVVGIPPSVAAKHKRVAVDRVDRRKGRSRVDGCNVAAPLLQDMFFYFYLFYFILFIHTENWHVVPESASAQQPSACS